MADKLKVRLDAHEASITELSGNPLMRLRELGKLASYLEHDHTFPPMTRAGLIVRAKEHSANTGQVGTIIFND